MSTPKLNRGKTSLSYWDITESPESVMTADQRQRIKERYQWAAEHSNDKDVLEIGAGAGFAIDYLSPITKTLILSDIDETAIEQLSKRSETLTNVEVLNFTDGKSRLVPKSVDVILFFESIYYFPNIEEILALSLDLLRPDGVILISMPNRNHYRFVPGLLSTSYPKTEFFLNFTISNNCNLKVYYKSIESDETSYFKRMVLKALIKGSLALGIYPHTIKSKSLIKGLLHYLRFSLPKVGSGARISTDSQSDPRSDARVLFYKITKL